MINYPINDLTYFPSEENYQDENFMENDSQNIIDETDKQQNYPTLNFETHFEGCMEMYSDISIVEKYLEQHQGWFCHCAKPMSVEALGEDGYILTVGHFGALGYEVEPKMAVILKPPENRIYDMYSIPVPNYIPPGYNVDYRSSMQLSEIPVHESYPGLKDAYKKCKREELPQKITQVKWQLHIYISVKFPKFIYKLPINFIQKTGDRVLAGIIKQISPGLTYKVQKDFHEKYQLPLPSKIGRRFQRL